MEKEERYVNKSVQRAISVLDLFCAGKTDLSVTDIANELGTLPGTVFPTLRTLERHGYLQRDNFKRYALGLKLLDRANLVLAKMDLRNVAQHMMREVATTIHVNTHLAVLYDGAVMYLHREEGYPSVIIKEVVGQRVPAYCTALGKMLLSGLSNAALELYLQSVVLEPLTPYTITDAERLRRELRTVSEQGYAIDNEEFHEGSLCIAAPIRDYHGTTLAAASLSVPKSVVAGGQLQRFVDVISDAALRISQEMGYNGPSQAVAKGGRSR